VPTCSPLLPRPVPAKCRFTRLVADAGGNETTSPSFTPIRRVSRALPGESRKALSCRPRGVRLRLAEDRCAWSNAYAFDYRSACKGARVGWVHRRNKEQRGGKARRLSRLREFDQFSCAAPDAWRDARLIVFWKRASCPEDQAAVLVSAEKIALTRSKQDRFIRSKRRLLVILLLFLPVSF